MTIIGRHTVAEARALLKAVDYQFGQVDGAFSKISKDWIAANQPRYAKLSADWTKAKSDWDAAKKSVKMKLDVLASSVGVATPEDIIPAEDQYNAVLAHTAQGGRNGDDSLYMTDRKITEITGERIDYSNQPSQDVWDADQKAYKKVDAAIKTGEKTAGDAGKSKTVLYVGLGAIGALALVGAAKVYL